MIWAFKVFHITSAHAPGSNMTAWRSGAAKRGLSHLELFYSYLQGSFNKTTSWKKDSSPKLNKQNCPQIWYFASEALQKYSFCFAFCCYFGKWRKPIWNRMYIRVKELGRTGFSSGWQGCSSGSWGAPPCHPLENPIHPFSFTRINPICQPDIIWPYYKQIKMCYANI